MEAARRIRDRAASTTSWDGRNGLHVHVQKAEILCVLLREGTRRAGDAHVFERDVGGRALGQTENLARFLRRAFAGDVEEMDAADHRRDVGDRFWLGL